MDTMHPNSLSGRNPAAALNLSGIDRLVYQLAGGFTLTTALLSLVSGSFVGGVLIDIVLGIGLLQLREGARRWMAVRTLAGAIIWPLLFLLQRSLGDAIAGSIGVWLLPAALLLLLVGHSRAWKITVSCIIFGLVLLLTLIGLAAR